MNKKIISIVIAVILSVFTAAGVAQRAGGRGKGQQAIVEMTTGNYERGWIKKEGKGKAFFTDESGKTTELTRGTKVHSLATIQKEYKQYEQSIMNQDLKDFEKYSKLLSWAQQHSLYEEVVKNAERMIRENPSTPDPEAQEALKTAREKLATIKAGPTAAGLRSDWTIEDVMKVRFALLPSKGRVENMSVVFQKQVLQDFLTAMNNEGKFQTKTQQQQFLQLPPTAQAQVIKTETGNKFRDGIRINKDPVQITEFRKVVEPLLNRSCATEACHGGGNLPFKLLFRPTNVQEVYANFYSLDTTKVDKGDLIDHGNPENSLFLSFLLPPGQGKGESHPTKIATPIKTQKDPRYRQVVQWIRSLPALPIDQAINQETVSTQPASISETSNPSNTAE